MIFRQIKSGGDRNFAYLIALKNSEQAALVDPSPDPRRVMKAIGKDIEIKYVINTHSHSDHSRGNDYFTVNSGNKPVTFINNRENPVTEDNHILYLGELKLEFISTPGHTTDSVCIRVKDKLVTGDTLFVGKVGGTYGREDAYREFKSLKKLMGLPPGTEVWPGHDYGVKPHSTIAYELDNNPFIKRLDNFEDFLWLKQNWSSYKIEHGIK